MNKIPEWITTGIKQMLVLYSLVILMTALAIGFLKYSGVEQSTLNIGYYIAVIIYTIIFAWKKYPERIIDWMDSKQNSIE